MKVNKELMVVLMTYSQEYLERRIMESNSIEEKNSYMDELNEIKKYWKNNSKKVV